MFSLFQITNPVIGTAEGWTGLQFFQRLLPSVITFGFIIGAMVFVFVFISGAIQWITAGGDKAQHESARDKLTNALVGLVIFLGIIAIIDLVERFFGISISLIEIGELRI